MGLTAHAPFFMYYCFFVELGNVRRRMEIRFERA